MSAAGLPAPRALVRARPGAWRLVRDQFGYAERELWRSRVALVFTFILPLVWLVLIGILAGNAAVDPDTGVRVMQFVTPTAAVIGMLFAAYPPVAFGLAQAREDKILKRLGGTPLPAWAYLAGRTAAAVILALAAVAVMLLVGVLAYEVQILGRTVPAAAVTILAGALCFTMLGLAVGAVASSASTAQSFALASAVAATFISGLFTIGADLPGWLESIADYLPVKPLATALAAQFNPFESGSGWDVRALAVLAAWGVGGALVAAWALRRAPAPAAPRVPAAPSARVGASGSARGGEGGGRVRMLADQAVWATRGSLREIGVLFFAVAMPVGLYALFGSSTGGGTMANGMPYPLFIACSMSAYGIAVVAFVDNPESVATARDSRVLKRLRGTPLASWQYVAGRTVAVLWIGLLTTALVFAVGVAFFAVRVSGPDGIAVAVLVLLLGTLTLAACGYALVAATTSRKAVASVGLGLLLPLAFFSDIFIVGAVPDWMATVGSVFPLRHFVHALADALNPAGMAIAWADLGVMAVWLAAAGGFALRRFRWEPAGDSGVPGPGAGG